MICESLISHVSLHILRVSGGASHQSPKPCLLPGSWDLARLLLTATLLCSTILASAISNRTHLKWYFFLSGSPFTDGSERRWGEWRQKMGERGKKEQGGTGRKDSPIIMFLKIPQGRKPSPTQAAGTMS